MIDMEKTCMALTLLALARFQLDMANLLVQPATWRFARDDMIKLTAKPL